MLSSFESSCGQSAIDGDALSESARSLLDAAPGMAYRRVNDGNWSLVYVSGGCRELLGYSPEEILEAEDKGFSQYIHPSQVEEFKNKAELAGRTKKRFAMAYMTSHNKGWDKWVWDTAACVYSDSGELLYMDGFVSNCSGAAKIEEAIRNSNVRFEEYVKGFRFGDMIGRSNAMQSVFKIILKVAESDTNTIIYGESGTGKELVAREIHRVSSRADKPFIPVNCGAIPENLMESELFGYRKGAFSGADKDKQGLLEAADGGTLFLDEVGEIPLNMQIKLLRAIEGDGFTPMGGCEVVKPDLRIVAATNRDMAEMVDKGLIRADFYYRINTIPINIPPLRKRKEDIALLFGVFTADTDKQETLTGVCLKALVDYDWPGNVRELRNQARRYMTLGTLDIPTVPKVRKEQPVGVTSTLQGTLQERMAQVEATILSEELVANQWNRTQTAKALGMDRRTLFTKIKRYGLELQPLSTKAG